jgi:hypothetical protein
MRSKAHSREVEETPSSDLSTHSPPKDLHSGLRPVTEGRAPLRGALIHYPGTGEKFDPPLRISRAEFWKKYQTYFPGVPPFFKTKGRPLKFHYREDFWYFFWNPAVQHYKNNPDDIDKDEILKEKHMTNAIHEWLKKNSEGAGDDTEGVENDTEGRAELRSALNTPPNGGVRPSVNEGPENFQTFFKHIRGGIIEGVDDNYCTQKLNTLLRRCRVDDVPQYDLVPSKVNFINNNPCWGGTCTLPNFIKDIYHREPKVERELCSRVEAPDVLRAKIPIEEETPTKKLAKYICAKHMLLRIEEEMLKNLLHNVDELIEARLDRTRDTCALFLDVENPGGADALDYLQRIATNRFDKTPASLLKHLHVYIVLSGAQPSLVEHIEAEAEKGAYPFTFEILKTKCKDKNSADMLIVRNISFWCGQGKYKHYAIITHDAFAKTFWKMTVTEHNDIPLPFPEGETPPKIQCFSKVKEFLKHF